MRFTRILGAIIATAVIAHSSIGCARQERRTGDRDEQGRPIEEVSSVRPNPEALQRDGDVVAVQRLTRVESVGDCAPRYKNGELGMCINNTPCRGFGVVDAAGVISCTCYGEAGGCSATERCDDRKVTCVPDDEQPFGRTRTP